MGAMSSNLGQELVEFLVFNFRSIRLRRRILVSCHKTRRSTPPFFMDGLGDFRMGIHSTQGVNKSWNTRIYSYSDLLRIKGPVISPVATL